MPSIIEYVLIGIAILILLGILEDPGSSLIVFCLIILFIWVVAPLLLVGIMMILTVLANVILS